MDENLPDSELLIRYLDQALSPAERERVEARLQNEEALRNELERLRLSVKAVQYYGLREQVAGIRREENRKTQPASGKVVPMHRPFRRLLAVAAVFLVLLSSAFVFYFSRLSGEGWYRESFVDYNLSATRSATATPPLEQAYQNGDYLQVILLGRSASLGEEDRLLLGLSYLKTNRVNEAIAQLKTVRELNGPYKPDAEFYLALSLAKAKQYKEAHTLLQAIHANEAHLYHNNVSAKQLRDLQLLSLKE